MIPTKLNIMINANVHNITAVEGFPLNFKK